MCHSPLPVHVHVLLEFRNILKILKAPEDLHSPVFLFKFSGGSLISSFWCTTSGTCKVKYPLEDSAVCFE